MKEGKEKLEKLEKLEKHISISLKHNRDIYMERCIKNISSFTKHTLKSMDRKRLYF